MAALYDAHLHLQDERLAVVLAEWEKLAEAQGVGAVLVNGTHPGDWEAVLVLAKRYERVLPSFGLHPWGVAEVEAGWREKLEAMLEEAAESGKLVGIGEVGLDKWIFSRKGWRAEDKRRNFVEQQEAFAWQLRLAAEKDLPLSIHCLQAWGTLKEMLETGPRPKRGFLIHAYGGPMEYVESFAELGAYFSFNGYFMRAGKEAKLEGFRRVPPERLLIETDAPDMLLPEDAVSYSLYDEQTGERLNHPGNLEASYRCASRCLSVSMGELRERVAENFRRWLA